VQRALVLASVVVLVAACGARSTAERVPSRPARLVPTRARAAPLPAPAASPPKSCPKAIGRSSSVNLSAFVDGLQLPGTAVEQPAQLVRTDSDGPWQVAGESVELGLASGTLSLVYLSYPGEGSGFGLLRRVQDHYCVIDSFTDSFGGNGSEIALRDQWIAPGGDFAALLFEIVGHVHGTGTTFTSWVVFGTDGDALWSLSPLEPQSYLSENELRSVRFRRQQAQLELVVDDRYRGKRSYPLDAARDGFVTDSERRVPKVAELPAAPPPADVRFEASALPRLVAAQQRAAYELRLAPLGQRVLAVAWDGLGRSLFDITDGELGDERKLMRGLPPSGASIRYLHGSFPQAAHLWLDERAKNRGSEYQWARDRWRRIGAVDGPDGLIPALTARDVGFRREQRSYALFTLTRPRGVLPFTPAPRPPGLRTPCRTALDPQFLVVTAGDEIHVIGTDCNARAARPASPLMESWSPGQNESRLVALPADPGGRACELIAVAARGVVMAAVGSLLDERGQDAGAYVAYFDGQAWSFVSAPPEMEQPRAATIAARGALFVGTANGVWRRDVDGAWRRVPLELGLTAERVFVQGLASDDAGAVWASGWYRVAPRGEQYFVARSRP
jgi:hypothetical protein